MDHNLADLSAMLAPGASVLRKDATKIADGLAQGTRVMTMDGMIPVEFLNEGDRIITRSGMRKLKAIEVSEYESAHTCKIPASVLGHDRPEADVTVGPATPVYIRDWRAKALYDRDQALVQAGRLADGEFIAIEQTPSAARFFNLVFDTREIFYAEGLEVASAS